MFTLNKNKLWFFIVFSFAGIIALQMPLSPLIGSKAKFTLFDTFAPVAGAFLGPMAGAFSVFLAQGINILLLDPNAVDTGAVIRLFPTIFAALYFGKRTKANVLIPLLAMFAFISHPTGRLVWFYSLFWLIPIVCYFIQETSLLARSLGATFTSHAVGGALWIYFITLPANVWVSLIPTVIFERTLFALGIAGTYLAVNNALNFLHKKKIILYQLPINEKYVWKRIGWK